MYSMYKKQERRRTKKKKICGLINLGKNSNRKMNIFLKFEKMTYPFYLFNLLFTL